MAEQLYQIHIALKHWKPKIWRRVILDPDIFLDDFHRIIQTTMGWTNSHLHEFKVGRKRYAPWEFELEYAFDAREVKLTAILDKEGAKVFYEYDFGDGWKHEIKLEKIITEKDEGQIPRCIDGQRNCPPEDCGSYHGYKQLLETIADPKHYDHKDMLIWLGGSFDPDYFDANKITEQLSEADYGCIWIE